MSSKVVDVSSFSPAPRGRPWSLDVQAPWEAIAITLTSVFPPPCSVPSLGSSVTGFCRVGDLQFFWFSVVCVFVHWRAWWSKSSLGEGTPGRHYHQQKYLRSKHLFSSVSQIVLSTEWCLNFDWMLRVPLDCHSRELCSPFSQAHHVLHRVDFWFGLLDDPAVEPTCEFWTVLYFSGSVFILLLERDGLSRLYPRHGIGQAESLFRKRGMRLKISLIS